MLPQEKEAVLVLASTLVFAVVAMLLRLWVSDYACEAVFAALVGFIASLWIGRQLVGLRPKALDERDIAIRYQAGMIGIHAFGSVIMVGAALLCAMHRATLSMPTLHMAQLAYYGFMAMYLVWSFSVLMLYRKGA